MCTVSVIPLGDDGLRLICNRDEQLTRTPALPPTLHRAGGRLAMFPTDPAGGGTWIAVNHAGVIFTLLNANSPGPRVTPPPLNSRGRIIPPMLRHRSVTAAADAARRIKPSSYAPFRIVIFDADELAEIESDGRHLRANVQRWNRSPQMFTSSGLGDHLVQTPRRDLFQRMVSSSDDLIAAQDEFHVHTWPDRPHVSVRMARRDARTVSRTIVERCDGVARLVYYDEIAQDTHELSLELCAGMLA